MSSASEGLFCSALQPNSTVSTYAVPSENQLGYGGGGGVSLDGDAKARRVQQQVALRLAERSSTIKRPSGSAQQYAASEYGDSSTMTKYQTYNPGFSSKSSYMYSTSSRPTMAQRMSTHSNSGYSSRSAVDFGGRSQMSRGAGVGMMYNQDDSMIMGMRTGGYHGGQSQHQQITTVNRTMSRPAGPDPEVTSLRSFHMQALPSQQTTMGTWNDSEGSQMSDHDAAYLHQEAAYGMSNGFAATYPRQSMYSTVSNGFSSNAMQTSMTLPTMRRSLSGTLARSGGGGGVVEDEPYARQSFKGPSQRTISRITQRQVRNSMSAGSIQGGGGGGSFIIGGSSQGNLAMMQQGRLSRAASMRSVISVGKGKDVFDGMDVAGSMGNLSGINTLDMPTAVSYLYSPEVEMQVLGAAYIQHECYHGKECKQLVNQLQGIAPLVSLFTSQSVEVQRYATGAARNLIYENMENKVALIEAEGIPQLMRALNVQDDELCKNITGILWNLSSKDNLKEKLAEDTLPVLTEKILFPLSGQQLISGHTSSEADIFFNTTGCIRNISSINEKIRQQMRNSNQLVNALVGYIHNCLDETEEEKAVEEKGVENSVCVLRNLSYQLYSEILPSVMLRLEGPSRAQASTRGEPIGCFTPQSKKAKDRQDKDLPTFSEVAKVPTGMEWLWHPKVVELYSKILQRCKKNSITREAAAGALQNITAGDKRWASVMSYVALEQERILPVVLDHLRTDNNLELRSITGLLRNLSRHAKDKNDMSTKVVRNLVSILQYDVPNNQLLFDVTINILGVLNNLVTSSELAARDIAYFDGIPKLINIRNTNDFTPAKEKAAKAACTVLCNMYQYKKLHKEYKKKGFHRSDFMDFV